MIISFLSPAWWGVMLLGVIAIILNYEFTKHKTREQKLNFLFWLSIASIVFLTVYKIWLFIDKGYDAEFFNELPINLCNLSLFFSCYAAKKDSKKAQAFMFYCCTLGAIMALCMPCDGFYDVPVYLLRCIGYWGFHILVLIICISYVAIGVYRPKIRDILPSCIILLIVVAFAHGCNVLLRSTVYSEANYCFTYGIEGNFLTETMMKIIPYPFIYEFAFIIPVVVVNIIMCWIANLPSKLRKKSETV